VGRIHQADSRTTGGRDFAGHPERENGTGVEIHQAVLLQSGRGGDEKFGGIHQGPRPTGRQEDRHHPGARFFGNDKAGLPQTGLSRRTEHSGRARGRFRGKIRRTALSVRAGHLRPLRTGIFRSEYRGQNGRQHGSLLRRPAGTRVAGRHFE